jgi:hypothetical protein
MAAVKIFSRIEMKLPITFCSGNLFYYTCLLATFLLYEQTVTTLCVVELLYGSAFYPSEVNFAV